MTTARPPSPEDHKVFRWLNFGSCMLRILFDTPVFFNEPYRGLPVAVSKIWRRPLHAIMNDWDVAPGLALESSEPQFADAWLSSREVFENADVILVDSILDIFYPQCLRFSKDGETPITNYTEVISNFPEEPPEHLFERIGVFDTSAQEALEAWQRFGQEISTPTVFVTYENNDAIQNGYSPAMRKRLCDLQDDIARMAERFDHWLVIDMDEVFARSGGADCYIDRHHPSDHGWKVLRSEIPRRIVQSGILRNEVGGSPLPGGTRFIPERGDFGALNPKHFHQLQELQASACAVGPERLTKAAVKHYGSGLRAYPSFGALKSEESAELIVVLKWDQPNRILPWMKGLMKENPEAIIDLPILWNGRENAFLTKEESALRPSLRAWGNENLKSSISLASLTDTEALYVARCLMDTHRFDRPAATLCPRAGDEGSSAVRCSDEFVQSLRAIERVPVFGPHYS